MSGIKIRSIPSNANPTPRPTTSYARPGTAARPSSSCGHMGLWNTSTNIPDDETQSVFEHVISESYLMKQYPNQNIAELESVTLMIDTSYQSLLDLADILPNLSKLFLDNSKLLTIRDLGTGLRHLQVLSVNNCGLTDLDGITMFTNLKCLYARDNLISDINALAMHEFIEEIDLHGNKITDISIGDILSTCPKLKKLFVTHNPISRAPKYRLIIASMIPQIEFLDSTLVDHNNKTKISNGMILEAASAMQLEQEELDDEKRMEMAILGDEFNTAMGYIPNYDITTNTTTTTSTSTPSTMTISSLRGDFTEKNSQNRAQGIFPDTGSDLTHGSSVVLAGNMATAMRRRRQCTPPSDDDLNQRNKASEHGALAALDSALLHGVTQKSRDEHLPYFGEGDITSLVLESNGIGIESGNERSPRPLTTGLRSPQLMSRSLPNGMRSRENSNLLSTSFDAEIGLLDPTDYLDVTQLQRPSSRGLSPSNHRTPTPGSARIRNGLPPSSPPIQRNASRPSSSRVSGIAAPTPSAPFKILVPVSSRTDNEDFANRISSQNLPSREGLNSRSDENGPGRIQNEIWDVSDDSSDDDTSGPRKSRIPRENNRRGYKETEKDKEEESANDQLSRRKMKNKNVSLNRTAACSSRPGSRSSPINEPPSPSSGRNSQGQVAHERNRNTNTLANVAGRSLGFDLRGSLAAINQWVEEMDSEEEEEGEDDDSDDENNNAPNHSHHRNPDHISHHSQTSRAQKILSRDNIIDMCIRAEDANFNDTQSHNSDEVAMSSEAYEENDVLFVDNNVDRTAGAERHSSSLHHSAAAHPLPHSPSRRAYPTTAASAPPIVTTTATATAAATTTAAARTAIHMSDDVLISMLSRPPKYVPEMRTKSTFQDFFRGITEERMKRLLHRAYGNLNDLEREVKVRKRMELLADIFTQADEI